MGANHTPPLDCSQLNTFAGVNYLTPRKRGGTVFINYDNPHWLMLHELLLKPENEGILLALVLSANRLTEIGASKGNGTNKSNGDG